LLKKKEEREYEAPFSEYSVFVAVKSMFHET